MNILISGGTGLIGSHLTAALIAEQHHVYILTRSPTNKSSTYLHFITWCPPSANVISYTVEQLQLKFDVIYNLAGAPIGPRRWTTQAKAEITASRLDSTRALVLFVQQLTVKPDVWINASAIGFYPADDTPYYDSQSYSPDDSFLSTVVQQWEASAAAVAQLGVRVVYCRFALILAPKGGAFAPLRLITKLGLSGKIASGEQWYSWIHLADCVAALLFIIKQPQLDGVVHLSAPHPVRQADFAKQLATTLHRPCFFPLPRFMLHTLLGDSAVLITEGQCVIPTKLTDAGFTFNYPFLKEALTMLVQTKRGIR
ncbi:TIGR01777 family oxidoreductase [Brochothrix campestris]|uniref:Cell division inhibitor n=1 Tax=Brochothrix campestris FSL F6-1037 TaxID=1265861 RepID=W7CRA3_9LIST|nr:TIGR01777 family oxidoreductase [Brochothrix campestris]EUJ35493.1 Cell division inhibitor [Brochothrix campestris FSL F6-1037]